MTVAELIAKLQEMPQEIHACVYDEWDGPAWVDEIEIKTVFDGTRIVLIR